MGVAHGVALSFRGKGDGLALRFDLGQRETGGLDLFFKGLFGGLLIEQVRPLGGQFVVLPGKPSMNARPECLGVMSGSDYAWHSYTPTLPAKAVPAVLTPAANRPRLMLTTQMALTEAISLFGSDDAPHKRNW